MSTKKKESAAPEPSLREHLKKIGGLRWKNPKNKAKNQAHLKLMHERAQEYYRKNKTKNV